MRVIQVPVADRPECVTALGMAFAIAGRTGADVKGIFIRAHRGMAIKVPVTSGWHQSWGETVDWMYASEKQALEHSRSAAALFKEIATANGYELARKPRKDLSPVAIWNERVGTPDHIMPIIGPTADMMVVSRPAKKGGLKAKAFLMQALMHSHRPVLVVPQKSVKSAGAHIAIAWNRSGEAARIVHGALPILKAADKVTFITVGPASGTGPGASEMVQFLRHHGVTAGKLSVAKGNAEQELLKACNTLGADVLAMGAYSHKRVSEVLFGGVTRHMMDAADIPVLMLHS